MKIVCATWDKLKCSPKWVKFSALPWSVINCTSIEIVNLFHSIQFNLELKFQWISYLWSSVPTRSKNTNSNSFLQFMRFNLRKLQALLFWGDRTSNSQIPNPVVPRFILNFIKYWLMDILKTKFTSQEKC